MQANAQGWHTEKWGTLGWVETGLKLLGIAVGLVALVRAFPLSTLVVSGHPHLAAVIVFALLTLGSIAVVALRFMQRETISMLFAVANTVGHVALLIALLYLPRHTRLPILFGVFYVLGQLVKHQFLRVSGYTESGANPRAMQVTTGVLTLLYAAFTILLLL